jgi:hypothetical protein
MTRVYGAVVIGAGKRSVERLLMTFAKLMQGMRLPFRKALGVTPRSYFK